MSIGFVFSVLSTPLFVLVVAYFLLKGRQRLKDKYKPPIYPIIIFLTFYALISSWAAICLELSKNLTFSGVIEKAYYEKPKQIPTITIKGIEYNLGYLNYRDYDTIVAGDMAIKEKGTFEFRLIKHKK